MRRSLTIISHECAWLSFVTFLVLALLEDWLPGFISLYFPPAIFLAGAVVATTVWLGLTAHGQHG